MAEPKYQTLSEFIQRPFGSSSPMGNDTKYAAIYQKMNSADEISFVAMAMIENSYYYHLQLPSESQQKQGNAYSYDVVIRFFTNDPSIMKEDHIRNYKIQFYSNSPSFIYNYAYLYHKNGFLIEEMYGKTDTEYINKPPTKRNPNMNMNYDKSIYVVCRFLADRQFRWLVKHGPAVQKKVSPQRFFRNIADFNTVKFDQALFSEEKKLAKELDKKAEDKERKSAENGKIKPGLTAGNTTKKGITIKPKITAMRRTTKLAKIVRPGRSTRKK